MKIKPTNILFHVIGCTIFLLLPLLLWREDGGIIEFINDDRAMRMYMTNILMLLFFYLIFYYLIPAYYFKKRYILFVFIILFCYFIIALLPEIVLPFHGHGPPSSAEFGPGSAPPSRWAPQGNRILFKLGHNLVFFLAVIFLSLMLKINNRLRQAEKEKLKAELSYFKAQINPHFLFNTLNTIYSLAIQKAENTPEAVIKLSGMMRYVITDASQDFVPLEKEISYITDYIDLQKIRFGETVTIDYKPCEQVEGRSIAPLILIPFIENAFKYGISPGSGSKIIISLDLSGSEIHMQISNQKVLTGNNEKANGLGIVNAKQRLSLLYPDKYRLIIDDMQKDYKVDLFIDLA